MIGSAIGISALAAKRLLHQVLDEVTADAVQRAAGFLGLNVDIVGFFAGLRERLGL